MGDQNNCRAAGLIVATVLCLLSAYVEARGSGAPTSACVSMTPGHGAANAALPYAIDIGATTTYSGGTAVTVTVTGGNYQGILLQARNPQGTPVGTFSNAPADTKTITCTTADSSITHANIATKNGLSFTWNPPSTDEGDVYFIATVAQSATVWKGNIRSRTMMSRGDPSMSNDATTMTDDMMTVPNGMVTVPDGMVTVPDGMVTVPDVMVTVPDGAAPNGNSSTSFLPEFIVITAAVLAAVRNFLW